MAWSVQPRLSSQLCFNLHPHRRSNHSACNEPPPAHQLPPVPASLAFFRVTQNFGELSRTGVQQRVHEQARHGRQAGIGVRSKAAAGSFTPQRSRRISSFSLSLPRCCCCSCYFGCNSVAVARVFSSLSLSSFLSLSLSHSLCAFVETIDLFSVSFLIGNISYRCCFSTLHSPLFCFAISYMISFFARIFFKGYTSVVYLIFFLELFICFFFPAFFCFFVSVCVCVVRLHF